MTDLVDEGETESDDGTEDECRGQHRWWRSPEVRELARAFLPCIELRELGPLTGQSIGDSGSSGTRGARGGNTLQRVRHRP